MGSVHLKEKVFLYRVGAEWLLIEETALLRADTDLKTPMLYLRLLP